MSACIRAMSEMQLRTGVRPVASCKMYTPNYFATTRNHCSKACAAYVCVRIANNSLMVAPYIPRDLVWDVVEMLARAAYVAFRHQLHERWLPNRQPVCRTHTRLPWLPRMVAVNAARAVCTRNGKLETHAACRKCPGRDQKFRNKLRSAIRLLQSTHKLLQSSSSNKFINKLLSHCASRATSTEKPG